MQMKVKMSKTQFKAKYYVYGLMTTFFFYLKYYSFYLNLFNETNKI